MLLLDISFFSVVDLRKEFGSDSGEEVVRGVGGEWVYGKGVVMYVY